MARETIKKFLYILPILLLLPNMVLGEVPYSRSPDGISVSGPFSISVSFNDYGADTGCDTSVYNFWGIIVGYTESGQTIPSDFYPSSVTSADFNNINLPPGEYRTVLFLCSVDGNKPSDTDLPSAVGNDLEGDGIPIIFTVTASAPILIAASTQLSATSTLSLDISTSTLSDATSTASSTLIASLLSLLEPLYLPFINTTSTSSSSEPIDLPITDSTSTLFASSSESVDPFITDATSTLFSSSSSSEPIDLPITDSTSTPLL